MGSSPSKGSSSPFGKRSSSKSALDQAKKAAEANRKSQGNSSSSNIQQERLSSASLPNTGVKDPPPNVQNSAISDSVVPLGHAAYAEGAYNGAPLPPDEEERMKTLSALKVLDTAPEERFDDLTRLACMIFKVPIALVSLVDKDRQWFKSHQGLAATFTDRKSSFCAWTLLPQHPEVLVVENTLTDARFKDNALVAGPPGIRFYAGCPLVASNKMRYGSLCIIDKEPRTFTADNCQMLSNLAEMVVRELEKEVLLEEQRQRSEMLSQENTQLLRAIDAFRCSVQVL
ncbi:GAF domain-like protein [Dunaliella salina]|uniref:GAF domain-like protein n=1 Tax=Dunaliella salina TaxID=3046 RepID=A0ABQ7GVD9_DUNSA|nr:GAF domain-like protein [Dunaliella salina]|eukprot:KAF5838512.1 GAF domain-like protein [Dunaliella salina]